MDQDLPVYETVSKKSIVNNILEALEEKGEVGDHDDAEDAEEEAPPSSKEMRGSKLLLKKGLNYYDFDFSKLCELEEELNKVLHQNFKQSTIEKLFTMLFQ